MMHWKSSLHFLCSFPRIVYSTMDFMDLFIYFPGSGGRTCLIPVNPPTISKSNQLLAVISLINTRRAGEQLGLFA